ncbi:hypothetical protein PybrP1_004765 [[Pythium] brassicae (nom. inval.)]|nr:hypothetical protein PybrP1_004765 [[Pythium] brassicae (nom. inval.)]
MAPAGNKGRASASQDDGSELEARVKQLRNTGGDAKKALAGVRELFEAHLATNNALASVRALDAASYLEDVLWPCVAASASASAPQRKALILSILVLVNERLRLRGGAAWRFLGDDASQWETFVAQLLALERGDWSAWEKSHLTFLRLASLPMWSALSPTQRQIEFQKSPKLERHWQSAIGSSDGDVEMADAAQTKPTKRRKTAKQPPPPAPGISSSHEKMFLPDLIRDFLDRISEPVKKAATGAAVDDELRYVALFMAFVNDLLSQLPTRRFLHVVLRRVHFLPLVRQSPLVAHCLEWRSQCEIAALQQQLALLAATMQSAIDAHTGKSLSAREQREAASKPIQALQQLVFRDYRNTPLEDLAIVPVSAIADGASFAGLLAPLVVAERAQVNFLAVQLGVVSDPDEASHLSNDELVSFFVGEYAVEPLQQWAEAPAYPTELDIWSDLLGDTESSRVYGADDTKLLPVLPTRKLNLQFLNVADYLQRTHDLFRLEAASAMRAVLEPSIKELDAVRSLTSATAETVFRGFSRVATPLSAPLQITSVSKPSLGKLTPASVVAQFEIALDSRHDARAFDAFEANEVVFLVTLRATNDEAAESMGFAPNGSERAGLLFPEQYGVLYVRGAEVIEVADAFGSVVGEGSRAAKGRKRTLKVALDGVQYKNDVDAGRLDAYEKVNVLVRRQTGESNFKAQLDAITSTYTRASVEDVLPSWLHDLFLGYGDPSAATYKAILTQRQEKEVRVQLLDVVADAEHVVETCLEGETTRLVDADDPKKTPLAAKDAIGPFTFVQDLVNDDRVAAVRSGMCDGLTVVVGAAGEQRTNVAVQLVLNLLRTVPRREKILLVAHSGAALDAFTRRFLDRKLVNESEIVRLDQTSSSSGSDDLGETGRVNFLLQRRLELLKEVEYMAKWLEGKDPSQNSGLSDSAGYSCENAMIFYQFHVRPLLEAARSEGSPGQDAVLREYFAARHGAAAESREALLEFAATLDAYFGELHRLQAFELLQTPKQRGDLFLMQHARVIAMTFKQAALSQRRLSRLGLAFSSLVMEEADEASELEALLPLLLAAKASASVAGSKQPASSSTSSLKRVVLFGALDAQAKPAVKAQALKTYAHLDQSLFARLLRLGVPRIELGAGAEKAAPKSRK